MGLTQADTTALTEGWAETMSLVEDTLISKGAWAWAFFKTWQPPPPEKCAATMRGICAAGENWTQYGAATMVQWTLNPPPYNHTFARTAPLLHVESDIAFFLAVRGPFWWLGYGWVGCSVPYDYPPGLTVDYGTPLGTCGETAPGSGVFERNWTMGVATVDCAAGRAYASQN